MDGALASMRHDHRFPSQAEVTTMHDAFAFSSPLGLLGGLADALFLEGYMRCFLVERAKVKRLAAERKTYDPARFLGIADLFHVEGPLGDAVCSHARCGRAHPSTGAIEGLRRCAPRVGAVGAARRRAPPRRLRARPRRVGRPDAGTALRATRPMLSLAAELREMLCSKKTSDAFFETRRRRL